MKKILLIIVLIIFWVSGCNYSSPESSSTPKNEQNLFENKGGEYTISYPSDWKYNEDANQSPTMGYDSSTMFYYMYKSNGGIVNVMANIYPADKTFNSNLMVEEYYWAFIHGLPNIKLLDDIKKSKVKINNGEIDSFESYYSFEAEENVMKCHGIFTIFNDKVYLLDFCAQKDSYNDFLEVGDNILNSFKIIK